MQPCQNYVQSPGEGHLELMNLGEVFLGAFFLLFPIEIAVRFAVAASSQNYEFGGSISPSYLSYLWRMKLLINQRFICGVFFELLHKNHQHLDNFAAFLHIYSTYLSYSLNGISQYVSFEEFSFPFTVVSSTSKQFKDLHNILL